MEREGLVIIEKSQTDQRSRCVLLTEAGLKCSRHTAEKAQGFLDALFQGIDEKEREIAGEVLIHMMQNLEQMQDSDS